MSNSTILKLWYDFQLWVTYDDKSFFTRFKRFYEKAFLLDALMWVYKGSKNRNLHLVNRCYLIIVT